jgi:hypothetical protein
MTKTMKIRRMAREPQSAAGPATRPPSKLDKVEALLRAEGGASIAELMEVTGWQQHSVRGALAGSIRKRGLTVTSEKVGDVRRYRVAAVQ